MWPGMGGGVAADDARGAFCESQFLCNGQGKTRGLVGDNAPHKPALLQVADKCFNAIEKRTFNADIALVLVIERVAQCGKFLVLRTDAKTDMKHAARAIGDMRPDGGQGPSPGGRAGSV